MTASMTPKTKLVGAELKAKVDELIKAGEGFSACCRATGYVNRSGKGVEIPAASGFSRALLDAVGYEFPTSGGGGMGGRGRDYKLNVMKGGNAVLSKGYLKEAGFDVADMLDIEVKEDGSIVLTTGKKTSGGAAPSTTVREPFDDGEWMDTTDF